MGAVSGVACMFHMAVGIGSGTDSLCFQRLKRIFRRHLAGDHAVEIFLQQHLIYRHYAVICFQKIHLPPIRRNALAAVTVFNNHLSRQHIRNNPDALRLKIAALIAKLHFLPRRMMFLLRIVIGSVGHSEIRIAGDQGLIMEKAIVIR